MSPRPPTRIYLDWNATTPPHPEVVAAMVGALGTAWGNPASVHGPGRHARSHVEAARDAVAALLGFDPRDVVLTSGGTEANNLALHHAFAEGGGALVVSGIEHPSVLRPAELLEARGVRVIRVAPLPTGEVLAEALVDQARDAGARLVSLQAVNHETGVIQPVAEVARLLRELRPRPLLHVDAVQAVGRLERSSWEGADLVTVAAHKIRGPKGVGAVAVRPGIQLRPVVAGGAQERGLRPGTQDAAACAGFAVAARRAVLGPSRYAALEPLRDRLEDGLRRIASSLGLDEPVRNGAAPRAPHVACWSVPGTRGDELAAALDLEGVAISSGSACSAGTSEPAPVVAAMVGRARAESSVRISLGEDTSADEIDDALERLERVLGRARAGSPKTA